MNGEKLLEHSERLAKVEANLDSLQRSVEEIKAQNQRIEEKLDQHLERIASLKGKITGIAVLVTTIVSGIVSGVVTLLFKKAGN